MLDFRISSCASGSGHGLVSAVGLDAAGEHLGGLGSLAEALIWLVSSSVRGREVFEMEHPHQIEDQGMP